MATYYAQRATAGLIVAEAATPNAAGQTYPNITAVHSARHVAGWRLVTDAVREAGAGCSSSSSTAAGSAIRPPAA